MTGKLPVRAIEFLVFSWMAKDCTSISKVFRIPILLSFLLILLFKVIAAPRRGARIHDPRDPKWHTPLTEPARLPPNKPFWKQVSVGLLRARCFSEPLPCSRRGIASPAAKLWGGVLETEERHPSWLHLPPRGGGGRRGGLLGPGEPLCAAGEDAASCRVTRVTRVDRPAAPRKRAPGPCSPPTAAYARGQEDATESCTEEAPAAQQVQSPVRGGAE